KGYFDQHEEFQSEVQKIKAKLEVITSHSEGLKKIKSFLDGLPKQLDEEQFSTQIAEYAGQTNVSILSFSPGTKQAEGWSEVSSLQFNGHSEKYQDFLQFLQLVEKSPFTLRVDSCVLTSTKDSIGSGGGVSAIIQLSSVNIKT